MYANKDNHLDLALTFNSLLQQHPSLLLLLLLPPPQFASLRERCFKYIGEGNITLLNGYDHHNGHSDSNMHQTRVMPP